MTAALQRHGVPATELGAPDDVDVLLVPDDPEHLDAELAATVLRVRPAATDLDDDLDEALARVAGAGRAGTERPDRAHRRARRGPWPR